MGFRHLVVRALRLVQETPGGMTPERLAFELNKSITYVKYSVIPTLTQISECVVFNRHDNIVKWICDDVREQTTEPAKA